jgi:hypothetical protein
VAIGGAGGAAVTEPVTGRCACGCRYKGIKQGDEVWLLEGDEWVNYSSTEPNIVFVAEPDDDFWAAFVQAQLLGQIE